MSHDESVQVVVELGTALARFSGSDADGVDFQARLDGYVGGLFQDLGLPGPSEVRVMSSDLPAGIGPYRMSIAGRAVPALRPEPVEEGMDAARLAARVAGDVARWREWFLTPATVSHLADDWQADPTSFHRVLQELARRCFRLGPTEGELPRIEAMPEDWPEDLVEAIAGTRRVGLEVAVSGALRNAQLLSGPDGTPVETVTLDDIREGFQGLFFEEMGITIPLIVVEVDPALAAHQFRFRVNDVRFPPVNGLGPGEVLLTQPLQWFTALGLEARPARHPASGREAGVVPLDRAPLSEAREAGAAVLGPPGFVASALARTIRAFAGSFLSRSLTEFHVNGLGTTEPLLVAAATAKYPMTRITAVLRRLLDEEIPVGDLSSILDAMVQVDGSVQIDQSRARMISPEDAVVWPAPEGEERRPAADDVADCVRRAMKRQVTHVHTGGGQILTALGVEWRVEARVRRAAADPLRDEEIDRLWREVQTAYTATASGPFPVALTSSEIRRTFRRLIEPEFPMLPVVSHEELAPGVQVRTARTIRLRSERAVEGGGGEGGKIDQADQADDRDPRQDGPA